MFLRTEGAPRDIDNGTARESHMKRDKKIKLSRKQFAPPENASGMNISGGLFRLGRFMLGWK